MRQRVGVIEWGGGQPDEAEPAVIEQAVVRAVHTVIGSVNPAERTIVSGAI